MAERRRNKKKKEDALKGDAEEKPSKEEYAVAKFLKQKLPEKKTTLLGHKVEYFIACKAVDLLVESKWAKENKKGELNFSNRDVAIDFMAKLLEHKFFHRAKKIVITKEVKKKKSDESTEKESAPKEKDSTPKEKDSKKSPKKKTEVSEEKDGKKEGGEEKKKEKKKIKLDMHLEQLFVDSNEPYVWIYDPIPLRTWITGSLMVVAAVLLCLFPLWPQTIRHYIYYLSVAAAFFLVFIIGLAVLRLVVFVLLWVFTLGKHHLWLLPNLTEDVGFFDSFWPLYKYDYKGPKKDTKEQDTSTKSQEEEEEKDNQEEEEDNTKDNNEEDEKEDNSSEDGQKTENGFEFIEAEEEESEEEENPKDK